MGLFDFTAFGVVGRPAELAIGPTRLDYVVMVETEGNEFG